MIDYEKLKYAHELAAKYGALTDSAVKISQSISPYFKSVFCFCLSTAFHGEKAYDSLDEIIAMLKSLIAEKEVPKKPEPKYKVGDKVFALCGNEIISFKIDEIINDKRVYWYLVYIDQNKVQFDKWREDVVYSSREALIKSQIEYWASLAGWRCVILAQ